VDVSGIAGNTEEIAVVDQFESRRLDLRPDQRFVRTVQGFDDARARAGFGRVIAHDQFAARLQRIIKSLIHLSAIDTKVSNVVIGIEKRHEIEIVHTRWRRILEWPHHRDDIGGRWGLEPRIEPILDARKDGFRILRINFAVRRYGARQKLRFPSPVYREDVEDFDAGLRANERQPLRRRAVGVELAIRGASVGRATIAA
jgi:hypothetical protein